MMRIGRGVAPSGRGHTTIPTGSGRAITFLFVQDARRYLKGGMPRNYRPNVGQKRYSQAELREQLTVMRGGNYIP